MNCGTCKHWDRKYDVPNYPLWRYCDKIQESPHAPDDAIAEVKFYGDAGADLITKAEFGCVLWESA